MSLRDYRDRVLERLRVGDFATDRVFDGPPDMQYHERPRRYLSVYTSREAVPSQILTGPQADEDVRFTVRAVGRTIDEAMTAQDHAFTRLTNAALSIEGRNSRPVRHVEGGTLRFDPDVAEGFYFYDDEYAWYSTKG